MNIDLPSLIADSPIQWPRLTFVVDMHKSLNTNGLQQPDEIGS